jgi:hypothetical protein
MLPVTSAAQQSRRGSADRRSADRGSDSRADGQRGSENRGDNRGSSDRRAEQRNSANDQRQSQTQRQSNTIGLSPLGLPPAAQNRVPAWEQKQMPWWERQGAPWWERQGPPKWEQANGWQNAHPNAVSNDRKSGHPANYRSGRYRYGSGYVYLVPSYGYYPYALPTVVDTYVEPPAEVVVQRPVEPPPPPAPPLPPIGVLRLEVEPRALIQIYVDGVYIGTPDDVGDDLGLSPGVRHIELRARGYISVAFDADIVQDRSITYRAQLERDPNAPPPPVMTIKPPEAGSKTMYVIPGCYLGNVAPTQAGLRPGCDLSKLTTITQ